MPLNRTSLGFTISDLPELCGPGDVADCVSSLRKHVSIVYGKDVRDWALSAARPSPALPAGRIGLFVLSWSNPRPDLEVTRLDDRSTMTTAAPLLSAATMDIAGPVPIVMQAADARVSGEIRIRTLAGRTHIGFWTRPEDSVSWEVEAKPGVYRSW